MKFHLYRGRILGRLVPLVVSALALSVFGNAVQLTTRQTLNRILLSNGRCDNFESIPVAGNQFQFAAGSVDEFTLIGAISGWVKPMVRYTPGPPAGGSIAILNAGYGGGPTKRMWASNGGGMTITYRVPVRAFGMDFYSFPGFGGNFTAVITMADGCRQRAFYVCAEHRAEVLRLRGQPVYLFSSLCR